MKCYFHDDREAVGLCTTCGRALCRQCAVTVGPKLRCESCYIESNLRLQPAALPKTERPSPKPEKELRGPLLTIGFIGTMLGILMPLISALFGLWPFGVPYGAGVILMAAFTGAWLVPQSLGFIGLYRSLREVPAMMAGVFGIIAGVLYFVTGAMVLITPYIYVLLAYIAVIYISVTPLLQAWALLSVRKHTGHDDLLVLTATVLLAAGAISWISILVAALSVSNLFLAILFLRIRTPPAPKATTLEPTIDPLGELL